MDNKLKQLRASHPNVVRRYTPLSVTVSASELRTGELQGKTYTVLDTVALRPDIVIRPLGSTVPEFVPADIHIGALRTFANRPVVMNHPVDDDGDAISANSPSVLEASQFGLIFEPRYDDVLGLVLPIWLNDEMAERVGDEAVQVLEDFRNSISREESVGVYAYIEELEGVAPDGTEFGAIWLDYDGDHLAILSKGDIGACSNDVGCGPILTTNNNGKDTSMNWKHVYLKSQVTIRRAMFNGEFSDVELRDKLDLALEASGAFGWTTSNYIKGKQFTYRAYDDESTQWKVFQRGYKLDSNGAVTLKDDVKEVIGNEPVFSNAVGGDTVTMPAAQAGLEVTVIDTGATQPTQPISTSKGDTTMSISAEVKRLVGVVIACERCPYTETDTPFLETKDEKFLEGLLETYSDSEGAEDIGGGSTGPEPVGAADGDSVDDNNVVEIPRDQWEATQSFVAEAKPIVARALASAKAEKEQLIAAIDVAKPSIAKSVYSAWGNDQLRAYHRDLGLAQPTRVDSDNLVTDFSLNGLEPPTVGVKVESIPSGLSGLRATKAAS
jgi:hypothetical protein